MKSLYDYINEAMNKQVNEGDESKSFTFNFKDMPNGKETLKSVVDMATDKGLDVESTEDSFTIKLTRELCQNNRDKIDGIQDVLQQFSEISRKDTKNASSESFAQMTKSFMLKVDEMVKFIDDAEEEDEEPEQDDKKDDDKKEDE